MTIKNLYVKDIIHYKNQYFKKRNELEAEISNVKARYSNLTLQERCKKLGIAYS